MSSILFSALHCLLSAGGVCYALETKYHHVASGGLKTCGICPVLYCYMCVCRLVISVQGVIIIDLSSLGCIVPEILKSIKKKKKKIEINCDISRVTDYRENTSFP